MKEETKQILEIVTDTQDKVSVLQDNMTTMQDNMSVMQGNMTVMQKNMATKGDLDQVKADMAEMGRSLHADIAAVHTELSERLDNHDGFTKEIDHALGRVSAVEKFVGFTPVMA